MIDSPSHITAPMREADAEVRTILGRARRSLDAVRILDNALDQKAWRHQQALLSRALRTWERFMARERMAASSQPVDAIPAAR